MSDQIIEDVLNAWGKDRGVAPIEVSPQVWLEFKERLLAEYLSLRAPIRAHGGVMPEDLPEVEKRGAGFHVGGLFVRQEQKPADLREEAVALLAIARRIEEGK